MAFSSSIVAFFVAVTVLAVLRPVAFALRLIDHPGGRKTHNGEIPIVGGLAIFAGLALAAGTRGDLGHNGTVVLAAAALMVLVGTIDDRFNLKPVIRLGAHATAAVALVYGTGYSVADLGNLFGFGDVGLGWLAVPFTIVACMALINAFNMLDGLDGLAGGTSLVAFIGLGLIAMSAAAPASTVISFSLTGAIIGFLVSNIPARFNRSMRCFMGDAGSTLLGFVLASVALLLIQPEAADLAPVLVLWLMPIPIFELFASTARRLITGVSPMVADEHHFHHRLVTAGFSVRCIFGVYLVFSALCAGAGLTLWRAGVPEPLLFAGFLILFVAWLQLVKAAPRIGAGLPVYLRRDVENLIH